MGSSNKSSQHGAKKQEGGSMKKLWGGRFTKSAEEWVDEFGASISFDQELVIEDIKGSIAHVTMLGKTGILTDEEADQIKKGLGNIKRKGNNDELEFSVGIRRYSFEFRKNVNRFNWSSWWKTSYRAKS